MSTKIYYGMVYNGSLMEAIETIQKWRNSIEPNISIKDYSKIREMYEEIKRNLSELESTIQLIPYHDIVLAIPFFTEELYLFNRKENPMSFEKMYEKFMKETGFEEYGYWNNTDKPDDVSEDEWDERERVWDEVIDYIPIKTYGVSIFISDLSSLTKLGRN